MVSSFYSFPLLPTRCVVLFLAVCSVYFVPHFPTKRFFFCWSPSFPSRPKNKKVGLGSGGKKGADSRKISINLQTCRLFMLRADHLLSPIFQKARRHKESEISWIPLNDSLTLISYPISDQGINVGMKFYINGFPSKGGDKGHGIKGCRAQRPHSTPFATT
jgi:hypothetical protein